MRVCHYSVPKRIRAHDISSYNVKQHEATTWSTFHILNSCYTLGYSGYIELPFIIVIWRLVCRLRRMTRVSCDWNRNILHITCMLASNMNFPQVHQACILLVTRIKSIQFAVHSQITHESHHQINFQSDCTRTCVWMSSLNWAVPYVCV